MSFLAGFDFGLDHIPGKKNVVADILSRLPHPDGSHDQGVSFVKPVMESTGFMGDWNVDLEDLDFGEPARPQLSFLPAQVPDTLERGEVFSVSGLEDSQPIGRVCSVAEVTGFVVLRR